MAALQEIDSPLGHSTESFGDTVTNGRRPETGVTDWQAVNCCRMTV
jgi:hypothetical protein